MLMSHARRRHPIHVVCSLLLRRHARERCLGRIVHVIGAAIHGVRRAVVSAIRVRGHAGIGKCGGSSGFGGRPKTGKQVTSARSWGGDSVIPDVRGGFDSVEGKWFDVLPTAA